MILITSAIIGLLLAMAMWYSYVTTRDPLHPLMYLAPLCIYSYSLKPMMLEYLGVMDSFFETDQLFLAQAVNALGLAAFCIGALHHAHHVTRLRVTVTTVRAELDRLLTPIARQRVLEMAVLLGGAAVVTYWFMVYRVGGLGVAYGSAKGGVAAASGYLGELPMLCLSAIGLLYLAWAGQRFTFARVLALLLVASPLIVHGLLGARRGPTFMVLAALGIGGYIFSSRRPKLITVFVTVFLLGGLMLFLVNNRDRIFIGSAALDDWTSSSQNRGDDTVSSGDDWIHSSGTIITSRGSGTHYWGLRILVNLMVRPIPKQIWATKYIDTGFGWLDDQEAMLGMTDNEWIAAVGWVPTRGAAAGFVADFYLEFAWVSLLFCWLLGWAYSWLWRNMVLHRGLWALLYLYAAILSIYVPTQNVTDAWIYRLVLLALPTIILWWMLVQPVLVNPTAGGFAESTTDTGGPMRLKRRRAFRRPELRPAVSTSPRHP